MGLEQYSYNEGDSDWFDTFVARVEKQSKGYNGISLTNFDTSTACAIASGSVVEINGAVFFADSETSVSGSISTGLNYIVFSVTGTTASPYFTTAAGSWDEAKQGYYSGTERYIGGFNSDGTNYEEKWIYDKIKRKSGLTSFRVYLSTNQTIATAQSATYVKVNWDKEEFDRAGDFDSITNNRLVCNQDGKYYFCANIRVFNMHGGYRTDVAIKVNTTTYVAINSAVGNADYHGYPCVGILLDLKDGDYVETYVQQNTGDTRNIDSNKWNTYFCGFRIL